VLVTVEVGAGPAPVSRTGSHQVLSAKSLRTNFSWTFVGNAVYAAGQWAILSLFAKLGDDRMLGEYALAVAITTPLVMLSHLNLRAVLATDIGRKHRFGDYLAVRIAVTSLGLTGVIALAWAKASSPTMAWIILTAGVAQSSETVSDIYYGALQRQDCMGRIARSMILRAVLSVGVLGAVLALTRSTLASVIALAAARLAVLLLYDRHAGEPLDRSGLPAQWAILRSALPLGAVLALISLNTNVPRYIIEHRLGTEALGVYAAVASFVTAGNTVVNALGQAAMPRLARSFAARNRDAVLRLAYQLVGLASALGVAGVGIAAIAGAPILRLLFHAGFVQHAWLLTQVMLAAVPAYVAATLGFVITSARVFGAQAELFLFVLATCMAASLLLIPRFGLSGAPMALACASGVQIIGEGVILALALRRMEAEKK